jgi:hypothetical protein
MAHLQGELLSMLQQAMARDLVSVWCGEVCALGSICFCSTPWMPHARPQQVSTSSSKELKGTVVAKFQVPRCLDDFG